MGSRLRFNEIRAPPSRYPRSGFWLRLEIGAFFLRKLGCSNVDGVTAPFPPHEPVGVRKRVDVGHISYVNRGVKRSPYLDYPRHGKPAIGGDVMPAGSDVGTDVLALHGKQLFDISISVYALLRVWGLWP